MNLLHEIHGLAEAVAEEQQARTSAFVPVNESICGIEVVPLDWERFNLLLATGSVFVSGGAEHLSDRQLGIEVARFMWLIHPRFDPKSIWRKAFFQARLAQYPAAAIIGGIQSYLEDAFADLPGGGKLTGKSYYSIFAGVVGMFGREYGWSETQTMKTSLKKSFQLTREIETWHAAQHGTKPILSNPSDRLKQEWLNKRCGAPTNPETN